MAKAFKWTIISETPIQPQHSNGGRTKKLIFKSETGKQFKIIVHSESYDFQSYATLYKWTDNDGFSVITKKNPVNDYNINIAYNPNFSQYAFDPIIKDLKKIAESFV